MLLVSLPYVAWGIEPCNAQANVSVNFIFLIVGLLVSSALPPLAFLLTWKRVPKGAAIAAAIGGQAAAIIAWLVHTKIVYETVDINTTQVSKSACQETATYDVLFSLSLITQAS